MESKLNLLDCTIEDLEKFLTEMGEQKFRAKQIFQWLSKGIYDIDEMTNLSKDLREKLKKVSTLSRFQIRNKLESKIDGTIKYLMTLQDGNIVECVLMRYKHGITACISSQVGCKMGCKFCASTGVGFVRNLSAGEMLDEILSIQSDTGERIGNVVIMGVGEPFDNYDNLIKFLKLVNSPEGLNIGYRHITISTCGIVPKIIDFSKEGIPATLAISLHASNDEVRSKIMPINNKYPIDKILEACNIYTRITSRRVTFEYAMISEVNDKAEYALELAEKLKGMLCHVNLIPVNSVPGTDYLRSSRQRIEKFKNILEKHRIETTIRRELGSDIDAACGQLRRRVIEERC